MAKMSTIGGQSATGGSSKPTLENIPMEIFDQILQSRTSPSAQHMSRLSQCSKSLQARLEPVMFSAYYRREAALLWACYNGWISMIHKILSYDPHIMEGKAGFSALYESSRQGQIETFNLILELGAPLENDDDCPPELLFFRKSDFRKLMRRVSGPNQAVMLKALLECGATRMSEKRYREMARECLMYVIKAGATPERVQLLIEHGAADVYSEEASAEDSPLDCPLAASILYDSPETFDSLLAAGADIKGTKCLNWPRVEWHKPIFAAAKMMHKQGVGVVEKCLAAGIEAPRCEQYNCAHVWPVMLYLNTVDFKRAKHDLQPIEGLKFWLDRGMQLKDGRLVHHVDDCKCQPNWSVIRFLMKKWSLKMIERDAFFEVLIYLAQYGMTLDEIVDFRRMTYRLPTVSLARARARQVMDILYKEQGELGILNQMRECGR